MTDWAFLRGIFRSARRWTTLAHVLLALTWVAGIGLLALSGWFITAAALAGAGLLLGLELFTPSAGIRAAALLRTMARYGERVVGHEAVLRVLATLRGRSFDSLSRLPIAAQRQLRSGDLQQRLTADIDILDAVPLRITGPMAAAALAVLAATLLAGWLAPWPAAAILLVTALLTGGASFAAARLGETRGRNLVDERARQRIALLDFFGGLADLIAFRRVAIRTSELERLEREQARRVHVQEALALTTEQAVQLLVALATLAMLALALTWHAAGTISAPVAVLLTLMTLGLNEALGTLPGAAWRLGESLQAAARLRTLGVTADPGARPAPRSDMAVAVPAPKLRAVGLEIGYTRGRPLLQKLDFALPMGVPLIIHGRTGLGKTTLLETLAGERSALGGSVTLGSRLLMDVPERQRYRSIGYLPQDSMLLDDSIGYNLRLGQTDLSDSALWQALEMVDLADTLRREGEGLAYPVGEAGKRLSGGQARRLALAGLILRDTPVVLLDEPFANLDAATSRRVLLRIRPWLEARRAVIVTHAPGHLPLDWPRLEVTAATARGLRE